MKKLIEEVITGLLIGFALLLLIRIGFMLFVICDVLVQLTCR